MESSQTFVFPGFGKHVKYIVVNLFSATLRELSLELEACLGHFSGVGHSDLPYVSFRNIVFSIKSAYTAIHAAMPPQTKPSRVVMGPPFAGELGADI